MRDTQKKGNNNNSNRKMNCNVTIDVIPQARNRTMLMSGIALLFRHNNIIPMKSWSKASLMQTIVYFYVAHIPLHSFPFAYGIYTQGQAHSPLILTCQ